MTDALPTLATLELTVTVIGPVVAPLGTVVVRTVPLVSTVGVAAVVPLNCTTLLVGVFGSKFAPLIVTVVPTGSMVGVNEVIVGVHTVGRKFVVLSTLPVRPSDV